MGWFNVVLFGLFLFPSQKSLPSLLCLQHPTILCFSCHSDSLEMETTDLIFSFRHYVFGGLCSGKKRHRTCLKQLRILSVQPMDCCNRETANVVSFGLVNRH